MAIVKLTGDRRLRIFCTYDERHKIKKAGASWEVKSKSWSLPFTTDNIDYMQENFQNLDIDDEILNLVGEQKEIEDRLEKLRILSEEDKHVQFRVAGVNIALYNYQKIGVMYALENPNGILLADSMGLGKTIQAISTACYKKYKDGIEDCLIITPASVKWNWPLEIEKFTNEKCVVIDGVPKKRTSQWLGEVVTEYNDDGKAIWVETEEKPFFYIVNYELLQEDLFGGKELTIKDTDSKEKIKKKQKQMEKSRQRAKELAPVKDKIWSCVFCDEVHLIKNHGSRRTKNVKKLKSKYRMGLTGTPMDGRLEELHSIMEWIVPGLFPSKSAFLQEHATFDFWGRIVKYKKIDEVKHKIRHFFLRRLKENVLKDLPDKIFKNIHINLSSQERKIYDQIVSGEHEVVEDDEALVRAIRCKQFCDHPALLDIDCKKQSKLDMLRDVLQEVVIENANKVIIFSQYSNMCEIIIEELDDLGLNHMYMWGETPTQERAAMQGRFNEDQSIDVLIGTEAMSTGLNLTGASYVINYDDNWSPAIMAQRADRAYRIGQKNTVTVINFVCMDTIEQRIRESLYNKDSISSNVLDDNLDEGVLRRLSPEEITRLM